MRIFRDINKLPSFKNAVITIGCVIQGETKHFDYVCAGVTQGIKDLNIQHTTPVIFCVLTDNNKQQSLDRSGGKHGNKGIEAAVEGSVFYSQSGFYCLGLAVLLCF